MKLKRIFVVFAAVTVMVAKAAVPAMALSYRRIFRPRCSTG